MPSHEFVLVRAENSDFVTTADCYLKLLGSTPEDIENLSHNNCIIIGRVRLNDDLFSYFYEIFCWVEGKTDNPTNPLISLGNNRWGVTVLDSQCQTVFSSIVTGFIQVFSVAPENIMVFGDFTFYQDMDGGEYEKIYISKQDMLNTLNTLKSFIEKLSEDGYYLIHLGI